MENMRKVAFWWTTLTYNNVIEAFAGAGIPRIWNMHLVKCAISGLKQTRRLSLVWFMGTVRQISSIRWISSIQLAEWLEVPFRTIFSINHYLIFNFQTSSQNRPSLTSLALGAVEGGTGRVLQKLSHCDTCSFLHDPVVHKDWIFVAPHAKSENWPMPSRYQRLCSGQDSDWEFFSYWVLTCSFLSPAEVN